VLITKGLVTRRGLLPLDIKETLYKLSLMNPMLTTEAMIADAPDEKGGGMGMGGMGMGM
jgi:hypothetical protein